MHDSADNEVTDEQLRDVVRRVRAIRRQNTLAIAAAIATALVVGGVLGVLIAVTIGPYFLTGRIYGLALVGGVAAGLFVNKRLHSKIQPHELQ